MQDRRLRCGSAEPGKVLAASRADGLVVATGEGAVRLDTIQAEGKKAMDAAAFLSGQKIEVGQKFANYRMPLVVIGDLTRWAAQSRALRDYVREANAGSGLWFVADQAELIERVSAGRG